MCLQDSEGQAQRPLVDGGAALPDLAHAAMPNLAPAALADLAHAAEELRSLTAFWCNVSDGQGLGPSGGDVTPLPVQATAAEGRRASSAPPPTAKSANKGPPVRSSTGACTSNVLPGGGCCNVACTGCVPRNVSCTGNVTMSPNRDGSQNVDNGLPDLATLRIGDVPSVFYWPEYVSREEEATLLRNIGAGRAPWTQVRPICSGVCRWAEGVRFGNQTFEKMLAGLTL